MRTIVFVAAALLVTAAAHAQSFPPAAQTVDGTPVTFGSFGPRIEEDEVCRGTIYVFGSNHGTGQLYVEVRMLLRRNVGQQAQGVFTQLVKTTTPVASNWTVSGGVDPDNGNVQATVTGETGETVDWLAVTDRVLCMAGPFIQP